MVYIAKGACNRIKYEVAAISRLPKNIGLFLQKSPMWYILQKADSANEFCKRQFQHSKFNLDFAFLCVLHVKK